MDYDHLRFRPVLRPVRQPLYDTLRFNGTTSERTFAFTDCFTRPDDTNLTQSCQLGTPLLFDLEALQYRIEAYDHLDDVQTLRCHSRLEFIFGGSTLYLKLPLTLFDPLMVTKPSDLRESVSREVKNFEATGLWPVYVADAKVAGKARRINSVEAFRAEIISTNQPLKGMVTMKVVMDGILWDSAM